MDMGPTLVGQGGATIGTCESFCGVGRGDPGGSVGEWPSSLTVEVCRDIAAAAPPVGVIDDVDDFARGVAPDAASLAEAGIPFPD